MNDSMHIMSGISTFPFKIFKGIWDKIDIGELNLKGNTVIEQVWISYKAIIMPRIKIGNRAIIRFFVSCNAKS